MPVPHFPAITVIYEVTYFRSDAASQPYNVLTFIIILTLYYIYLSLLQPDSISELPHYYIIFIYTLSHRFGDDEDYTPCQDYAREEKESKDGDILCHAYYFHFRR